MFRLFKAELKKIFMKPSIFVVTGLIILMLAFSFFVFSPKDKTDYLDTYAPYSLISGNTASFDNWYSQGFNTADSSEELRNRDAITYLNNASNIIDFYVNYDTETDGIVYIKNLWSNLQISYDNFSSIYSSSKSNDTERNDLLAQITNFETQYNLMANNNLKIYFFVKSNVHENISKYLYELKDTYTRLNMITNTSSNKGAKDAYVINSFRNSGIFNYQDKNGYMLNALNTIVQCKPNKNSIKTLETYVTTAATRLLDQQVEVEKYYNDNKNDSPKQAQIERLRKYIADYKLTAKYAFDVIKYGSFYYGIPKSIETSLTSYNGFQSMNLYQIEIAYNQKTYMFDNGLYEYNYATPFSLSEPSNQSANGYDFSYFALRLCSLFITIYLVVLAAGTIAGEQSAGTLKLLAIRPFSRSKLLTGKSLAIFAIGGILLAVSSVASLVVGAVTYGLSSQTIITIFNGTTTIMISPFALYIIAFLTMYVEILFYASLSIFISTAFKSNVGAVSISTLAFFISLILNGILTNVPVIGFLPFTNICFFKYFGSTFATNSGDFISSILSPGVFIGSTFWSSLIIYLISVAVLIYIPHLIFKNRDLK